MKAYMKNYKPMRGIYKLRNKRGKKPSGINLQRKEFAQSGAFIRPNGTMVRPNGSSFDRMEVDSGFSDVKSTFPWSFEAIRPNQCPFARMVHQFGRMDFCMAYFRLLKLWMPSRHCGDLEEDLECFGNLRYACLIFDQSI